MSRGQIINHYCIYYNLFLPDRQGVWRDRDPVQRERRRRRRVLLPRQQLGRHHVQEDHRVGPGGTKEGEENQS